VHFTINILFDNDIVECSFKADVLELHNTAVTRVYAVIPSAAWSEAVPRWAMEELILILFYTTTALGN